LRTFAFVTDMDRKTCKQCGNAFSSRRQHAQFCSNICRAKHHRDDPPASEGPIGTVKIVRAIKSGTSVTLHFTDEVQAQRALKTALGAPARLIAESMKDKQ